MSAPNEKAERADILNDFDSAAKRKDFKEMSFIIHELVKYGNDDDADTLQARFDDLWAEEKWVIAEQA